MTAEAENVVRSFIDRINAQDPDGILALCAPDHIFVDSLGGSLSGNENLAEGWRGYFAMFPDYRIEIESLLAKDDLVLACGFASGTHAASGSSWRIPAAWRALVRRRRVAHWQVFADNKPVYELLSRER